MSEQAEPMNIYRERAHLVAYLASQYPSALSYSDPSEPSWPVVTITTPTGQMTWHISEDDIDLFGHVPIVHPRRPEVVWDGHTTPEKYERLRKLTGDREKLAADKAAKADRRAQAEIALAPYAVDANQRRTMAEAVVDSLAPCQEGTL